MRSGRCIRPIIPQKRNERPAYLMDWSRYRERNRIERLVNRLKQYRRIATRYDKTAPSYVRSWPSPPFGCGCRIGLGLQPCKEAVMTVQYEFSGQTAVVTGAAKG